MNLYLTVEFRRCLDLFSASIDLRTYSSLICHASVQFQKKIPKISLRRYVIPNTQNLVISRCCFAEDGKEMYKDL